MLPPPAHARFVHRDLDQPGAELRLAAKLPQVGKGLQDGFLRHILRVGVIAQQRQRGDINPALVRLHQFGKERRFSVANAVDERLLRFHRLASAGLSAIVIRRSIWIYLATVSRPPCYNDGVILRDFSPEGSSAHRHKLPPSVRSAPRQILRKLRMTSSVRDARFANGLRKPQRSRYSGFFFHPVSMEAKLFQPCRTTMTRCPEKEEENRPHHRKMPDTGPVKAAHHPGQPGKLHRLPHRKPGEYRQNAQAEHGRVRQLLQRVVNLADNRFGSEEKVVVHHGPDAREYRAA